jgi:hypothetical protein
VGVLPPVPATVAVKVTGSPAALEVVDWESVVVVVSRLTTWVTSAELGAKVTSPW